MRTRSAAESAAQRFKSVADESGVPEATADRSGECSCENRARTVSSSNVALSDTRYSARSAKKFTATSTPARSAINVRASFQKRLRRTCLEQIPRAAHCLQMVGIFRVAFDFFAQAADINIHAARRNKAIGAPDGIQKLIPRKYAVRA